MLPQRGLLARRKDDVLLVLHCGVHATCEFDVHHQSVLWNKLGAREREPDGPLGVTEVLRPARPSVDMVPETVVRVVRSLAPVVQALRHRLRPV